MILGTQQFTDLESTVSQYTFCLDLTVSLQSKESQEYLI